MIKQLLIAAGLAACVVMAGSCRMVEVASLPRTLKVEISATDPSQYRACLLNRSGEFAPLRPVRKGLFVLIIPSMDGGYTEFGCVRYNRHIPEEYPVLRVMKGENIVKELSIRDIEKLPAVERGIPDQCYLKARSRVSAYRTCRAMARNISIVSISMSSPSLL